MTKTRFPTQEEKNTILTNCHPYNDTGVKVVEFCNGKVVRERLIRSEPEYVTIGGLRHKKHNCDCAWCLGFPF